MTDPADILDRLHRIYREACAEWEAQPSGLVEVLLDAKVEIERLRAALRELLTANEWVANSENGGDFGEVVGPAAEKAYAALGEDEG